MVMDRWRVAMKRIPIDECPASTALDAAVEEVQGNATCARHYSRDIAAAWGLAEWILEHMNYDSCSSYVQHGYAQFSFHALKWSHSKWPPVENGEVYTVTGEAKPDFKLDQCGVTVLPLAITRAFLRANEVEYIEVPDD
jgi:hypothetical protein